MNGYITEVGSMNIFLVFDKGDGRKEIVTPPLIRGDILPGVTRSSIVELTSAWKGYDMVERNVAIEEVQSAVKAGTLVEAFGSGTAAVVCPTVQSVLITTVKI
jgi:branched-chain amino acid aminotransferase